MAKIKVKLDYLNGVNFPTCHHIAIRNFDTDRVIAYSHLDDIFTEPHRDEPYLVSEIKRVTSRLVTKTIAAAKLAVDGFEFEDQVDTRISR